MEKVIPPKNEIENIVDTIETFDANSIYVNPHIIMIGKRGIGKSSLVRHIVGCMYQNNSFDELVIFSRTKKGFYDSFTKGHIHDNYSSYIIENILETQKTRLDQGNNQKILIVFDDCFSSNQLKVDPQLAELLYNGRYYNIGFVLTLQFPAKIKPEIRQNFNYVFLFSEDFITNIKRIYAHYAGMFPDYASFENIFHKLTCDFGVMCITNRPNTNTILGRVAKIKNFICNDINLSINLTNYGEIKYQTLNPQDQILNPQDQTEVSLDQTEISQDQMLNPQDQMLNPQDQPEISQDQTEISTKSLLYKILSINEKVVDILATRYYN